MKATLFRLLLLPCLLLPRCPCAQMIELAAPSESEKGRFGFGVLGMTDLTGDGVGELAVATTEAAGGLASAGSVYLLDGRDFSVFRRIVSPRPAVGPASSFGTALAEVPDVDGDRVSELLVTSLQEGRAYLSSGSTGRLLQTFHSPAPDSGGWWGIAAAALATSRPNVASTIAISTPGANGERGDAATIHIFDSVSGQRLFSIENPGAHRWFGASMASLGDIDGDGRDDLVASAGSSVPPYYPGAAYVLSGETGKVLHRLLAPVPANAPFEWTVAAVPDVNVDGKTDVLVGMGGSARAGAPTQSGHAYLFSGADGRLLRSIPSPGEMARGGFGWSVAGVPDLTGDGAGELLIGAGTNPFLTGFETYGERRMYLINGATGETITAFKSPYAGESMGWGVTVLLGRNGQVKDLVAGLPREKALKGRVLAFPVRRLAIARLAESYRVSLTSPEECDHELQSSPDLQRWTTVTTLKAGQAPAMLLEREIDGPKQRFYRAKQVPPAP